MFSQTAIFLLVVATSEIKRLHTAFETLGLHVCIQSVFWSFGLKLYVHFKNCSFF